MAVTRIAAAVGISRAAVSQWRRVPEKHVAVVAKLTRISRKRLRPDLYPVREPAE
jgi:pyruvate kinase